MKDVFTVYRSDYYISKEIYQKKRTPPRILSCYELEFYTTSGNTSIINDTKYPQEENNILVACPGDIRYSIDSFECYCVHFSCEVEEVATALTQLPNVFNCPNTEQILSLFKIISATYSSKSNGNDLFLQAKILELISVLVKENTLTATTQHEKYSQNIQSACFFMATNFDKHLTLKEIAGRCNLSPSFFHSLFKLVKNITPHEYLLRLRLSMAKNLLRNSSKSLIEISLMCGFESQSYFSYMFKREVGITPLTYRKNTQLII